MTRSKPWLLSVVATTVVMAGLVPVAGAAASGAESGVGVVAEYRPAAGRFAFTRPPGGENVPVRIGLVVMAGDLVTLPAGASVTVQLANGETTIFKGPGRFAVPTSSALGKLGAIFQSMMDLADEDFRLAGTAASRGGESCRQDGAPVHPIEVPILVRGARIVAGKRDLPLAWRGGCPPFVVKLVSGKDSLVDRESIEGWQVRLDDVPLSVGHYSVVINDATGRHFEGSLEAVSQGPTIPPDLAADTSKLGTIAQAAWLAGQDDGQWRLESFERLRPLIRAGDPLAGSIGDGVLWGLPR